MLMIKSNLENRIAMLPVENKFGDLESRMLPAPKSIKYFHLVMNRIDLIVSFVSVDRVFM